MVIAVQIWSIYKLMIAMLFNSEFSRLEEDKSPFVNDVTHVAYGQELGSTGLQDEFQGYVSK